MKGEHKGPFRFIKAAQYSWKGLKASFKHEEAFRQELFLVIILAPIALWLGETGVERALMLGSLLLVLIVELLNSAVEAEVDRHGTEFNKLAGRAKDMGSAAVMISLINVAVIWGLILYERLS